MSQVLEIRRTEQLDSYRLIWNLLESRSNEASFYRSWDWTRMWLQRRRGTAQPRVLIVFSGTEPVGILPLCQTTHRTVLGNVRLLGYPVEPGVTDCGPVGPNPMATLMAALRYLGDRPNTWQFLELREYASSRPLRGLSRTALRQVGLSALTQQSAPLRTLEMSRLAGLAAEAGPARSPRDPSWQFVRSRPAGSTQGDGSIAPELLDACRQVAVRSGPEAASQSTSLLNIRDDWNEILSVAANHGMLDVALGYQHGEPIAFAIHFCGHGVLHRVASGCVASEVGPGVEQAFWSQLAQDSLQRGDRLAVFPAASLPMLTAGQASATAANVEVVRTMHGWRSQVLSRRALDRLFQPSANHLVATRVGPFENGRPRRAGALDG